MNQNAQSLTNGIYTNTAISAAEKISVVLVAWRRYDLFQESICLLIQLVASSNRLS